MKPPTKTMIILSAVTFALNALAATLYALAGRTFLSVMFGIASACWIFSLVMNVKTYRIRQEWYRIVHETPRIIRTGGER